MYVLCVGLKHVWQDTLGALLHAIGDVGFGGVFGHGSVHPLRFVSHASDDIENKLGDLASGYEHAMGFWFHQTARLQGWIADETWKISRDLYHFGGWVVHTYVPAYVHGVTDIIHTVTNTTTKVVHVTETKVVHLTRTVVVTAKNEAAHAIPNVTIPYVGEWRWLHKHWKALAAAIAAAGGLALPKPVAWPQFRRTWKEIEEWRETTLRRLRRLEKLLAASGLALAVANLTGTRASCWRGRGNIARVLRNICGLDAALLGTLLASLFEAFAIADLCDLIKAEVKLAEWFRPLLMDLVDVDEWLIKNCSYDAPADLNVTPITLPPGRYGLTLNEDLDVTLGLAA